MDHFSALVAGLAGVCSALLGVASWDDLEAVRERERRGVKSGVSTKGRSSWHWEGP